MMLCIELGRDQFTLRFKVLDNPVAERWLERMDLRTPYPLDDPKRFYGFGSREEEIVRATAFITHCIAVINDFEPIIKQEFTHVDDQDCLNYLHHIFEVYHGLLDKQDHELWQRAPTSVRKALADLNIAVHRCETVSRENQPRFVCTWYGLPKTETLAPDLIETYGDLIPKFGSVCLNYCEIGKTAEDLMQDNDRYIADDAFKPFSHYSADFVVRMFEETQDSFKLKISKLEEYFLEHQEFFSKHGHTKLDSYAITPYRITVAELVEEMPRSDLLKEIAKRQHVNKVYFNDYM